MNRTRLRFHFTALALAAALPALLMAAAPKLSPEDRLEIIRGLSAEYATAKKLLPGSKKPLPILPDGTFDKEQWDAAYNQSGPAARAGDTVQVTKVEIGKDEIKLEINGGAKSGVKWSDRVQVGTGTRSYPIGRSGTATNGTTLALQFPGGVPSIESKDIKKMLAPILDFEKRSATENYVDTLPAPIQAAIKENRAIEGMNRDQVLLALGKPRHKTRETTDGVELEDWIYGMPPGKISFVTFNGDKVVKVKEAYAGLGGSTADRLPVN